MNITIEAQVVEATIDTVAEAAPAVVELDLTDLNMVGGGLVSPCFA